MAPSFGEVEKLQSTAGPCSASRKVGNGARAKQSGGALIELPRLACCSFAPTKARAPGAKSAWSPALSSKLFFLPCSHPCSRRSSHSLTPFILQVAPCAPRGVEGAMLRAWRVLFIGAELTFAAQLLPRCCAQAPASPAPMRHDSPFLALQKDNAG